MAWTEAEQAPEDQHPMRFFPPLLLATLLYASVAGCAQQTQPDVTQFGEMRQVMRMGHTEPRISLTDAVRQPHAIGVGALEGLAGEITIIDGNVWVARVTETGLQITGPEPDDRDQATLLTLAHVAQWKSVTIETTLEGRDLESFIERTAIAQGLDTTTPFPFVIEGKTANMSLHVINGYCPIATDPATIDAKPWRWSSPKPIEAVIVGFFAKDAAGVMTHHSTSIHAHAILSIEGKTTTGHLDQVSVTPGMTLRVPSVK